MTEPTASSPASVPGLAEVLERLDRLESALRELIQVTAARAPAPVAVREVAAQPVIAREVTGTAAAGEPPLIRVAPPAGGPPAIRVAPPAAVAQAAEPRPAGDASVRAYDPNEGRADLEGVPPDATIHQVLTRVFEAGLMPHPEDTWAIMAKLMHSSQVQGPRALDHFKAFAWPKLRRTAASYLHDGSPASFTVAYTEPAEISASDERVRVFIKADERMPVPIGLARDKTQGNAWRVTMMSL